MEYPKRKNIRLAKNLYQGPLVISVTLCFYRNINTENNDLTDVIIKTLPQITTKYSIDIYAYCLMPNHLHWLFGLTNDKHNTLDVITHFKNRVSFEMKGKHQAKQL